MLSVITRSKVYNEYESSFDKKNVGYFYII